jgi:hypothetical protein
MHFLFPLKHAAWPTHLILYDLITILDESREIVTDKVVIVRGQKEKGMMISF